MRDKSQFESEADFTTWIQRRIPRRVAGLTLGIGDDAALVRIPPGRELILTTDLSFEGVHFMPALHPPRAVGHRALARSLSDIAAMGGNATLCLDFTGRIGTRRASVVGRILRRAVRSRPAVCRGRHWR